MPLLQLCSGSLVTLVIAFVFSPLATPPSFWDDKVEMLIDLVAPMRPVPLLADPNYKTAWTDILPWRPAFCSPIAKKEVCDVYRRFQPLPEDVIITTIPKTGTTLLQQVTQQLRTGGDMNFIDIYDVQPWIHMHPAYRGPAENVEQRAKPRVFKNHNRLSEFMGGKHIVVLRDPVDILASWHSFLMAKDVPFVRHNGYLWLIAEMLGVPRSAGVRVLGETFKTAEEFAKSSLGWKRDMAFGAAVTEYLVEFWVARRDPRVLLIEFNDLVARKDKWIPIIGEFMGLEVSSNLSSAVSQMTSKEFMEKHISKFDESAIVDEINSAGKLMFPVQAAPRVTKTTRTFSAELREEIQAQWNEQVLPVLGFATYMDMKDAWMSEVATRFPSLAS
eukprot:TRINITY_DN48159_c0_g1_i1.p1 TRINITY_DN48159_c0_g1~~TRINITY_DN48159_c0_g1_i1.p1  ORF type:complete len:388 (-),score=51.57 TRINITY_DN48159_c0_g1_i1:81-1244(-)